MSAPLLIDADVMECTFREPMAERDLLFHDRVAATILSRPSNDPQAALSALLLKKPRQDCLGYFPSTSHR